MKRIASRQSRSRSPVSVTKLHSSIPRSPRQSMSRNGIPLARSTRSEPLENGCAAKPKPPARSTAAQTPAESSPVWSIGSSKPKAR